MTFETSTITVAGQNISLTKVEHPTGTPAFVDFQVTDAHGLNIGRVWEYEGRWRAKPAPGDRFVEMPKMLEAMEVLVRMRRTIIDQAGLHVEDGSQWVDDGKWHLMEEPKPATGFLNGLIMHTCPGGSGEPFVANLLNERDDRHVYEWDGHTPFALVVEWIETWIVHLDRPMQNDKGEFVDPNGRPMRRVTDVRDRPGPLTWERLVGRTPFIIAYKIDAC